MPKIIKIGQRFNVLERPVVMNARKLRWIIN